jgi:hypothetical protein
MRRRATSRGDAAIPRQGSSKRRRLATPVSRLEKRGAVILSWRFLAFDKAEVVERIRHRTQVTQYR